MRLLLAATALAAALALAAGAAGAVEVSGRVFDLQGRPVRDAVVFVEQLPAGVAPPAAPATARMDQVNKQFVPHVLPVAVGTSVFFPNHDQIHHHVYSLSRAKTFEIPLYKGEPASPVLFDKPGAVKLGCNIHDWMSGVILVLPTPYFARTGNDGAFALPDLPPGSYDVAVWSERYRGDVEATRRTISTEAATPLTFTIDAQPPRRRPAARRGYE